MTAFISNPQLELAFDYVRNTDKNIFLTGKAGTGKTTFLHQIKNEQIKRMVVVAPTGVAAINAGGMTIHSFFQLPFGPYLPGNTQEINRQRRFAREKIRVIQSLDLLVIDEISMVRADLLDGIDDVLRRYKDHSKPFGGVQLLMIGDLHQLSPIVKDEEWGLLREHYATPYFFSSMALLKSNPVSIELQHIYRQSDDTFIKLLNKVRNNAMDAEVLALLNSRYIANFTPSDEEAYITLTSHNAAAQEINAQKLESIPAPAAVFKAITEGDFPAYSYPADEVLTCKVGAQVMFIKNDISREKLYYNGKIGQVMRIKDGVIYVKCPTDIDEIAAVKVGWDNVKYTLDETTKEVKEDIIGTFTQYPLKLAWAITIHKSQGLTFDRAIIEAQAAFAHGQVYVALSRCRSFEGIVLRSKIIPSSVKTDATVRQYTEEADKNKPDENHLLQSKIAFQQSLILELFGFRPLKRLFDQMNRVFMEHEKILIGPDFSNFKQLLQQAENDVFVPAEKFGPPLQSYFQEPGLPESNETLQTRLQKAGTYFAEKLGSELLPGLKNLQIITDNKVVRKTALEALERLQKEVFVKNACLHAAKTAFSAQSYLRTKANAAIDFSFVPQIPLSGKGAVSVPPNTPHPTLYIQIKQWREDLATANGVELYEVLPTKTLQELVQFLPLTLKSLKKIKGIGPAKTSQFGQELITMIQQYCVANKLFIAPMSFEEPEPAPEPEPVKVPKVDTKTVSFELYKSGKSIEQIAEERGFTPGTVAGHLAHFIGLGQLDIFDFMERKKVIELVNFLYENNTTLASEVQAYFGELYSYSEIKMVVAHMTWELAHLDDGL